MGQLKPGVTYIYERADGITYAREFGETKREVIGMDYPVHMHVNWHDVELTARTNPALQQALDRAILLYKLSKETLNG
jgi:hypothetical protein